MDRPPLPRRGAPLALALLCVGCSTLASVCVSFEPAKTGGLSDEFDTQTLPAKWQPVNAKTFTTTMAKGRLTMTPKGKVVWWKADSGPLLYQLVKGNFRVSARVFARKASAPDKSPDEGYQFGGIIARSPASDGADAKESYVFAVTGYRGKYLCVENKTTRDDVSYVDGPKWPGSDAELRICRLNAKVHLYRRPIGGDTWEKTITYKRPDLPEKLQVGPIVYALTERPDVMASFDWIRFAPVSSLEDCLRD